MGDGPDKLPRIHAYVIFPKDRNPFNSKYIITFDVLRFNMWERTKYYNILVVKVLFTPNIKGLQFIDIEVAFDWFKLIFYCAREQYYIMKFGQRINLT